MMTGEFTMTSRQGLYPADRTASSIAPSASVTPTATVTVTKTHRFRRPACADRSMELSFCNIRSGSTNHRGHWDGPRIAPCRMRPPSKGIRASIIGLTILRPGAYRVVSGNAGREILSMARIAFVKVFTGLQMGIAQLSGELQRAGHQSLIVYFKDYVFAPDNERDKYCQSELGGAYVAAKGKLVNGNLYKRFTDLEYELLVDTLRRFDPDMIGFSLCSVAVA